MFVFMPCRSAASSKMVVSQDARFSNDCTAFAEIKEIIATIFIRCLRLSRTSDSLWVSSCMYVANCRGPTPGLGPGLLLTTDSAAG